MHVDPRSVYAPADTRWVLARATFDQPGPRVRHVEVQEARRSRPGAPQAVAGTLADRQWRADTKHAMADRAVAAGMGPEAAWEVLGRHVDARNGPARTVKVGLYRV